MSHVDLYRVATKSSYLHPQPTRRKPARDGILPTRQLALPVGVLAGAILDRALARVLHSQDRRWHWPDAALAYALGAYDARAAHLDDDLADDGDAHRADAAGPHFAFAAVAGAGNLVQGNEGA